MKHQIVSITQRLRLPSTCVICSQYHREPYAVCRTCLDLFQPLGPACSYCAFPLNNDAFLVCGNCSTVKPNFDTTFTAYRFEEPLRTLLHHYKYHGALFLRSFLTKLMLDALPKTGIKSHCLVPVPLHPHKLRARGFNQAAELCKALAKYLHLPYQLNLCKKITHTIAQATLTAKERKKNLHLTFEAAPHPYQHITLIDDLLTTGSTANELSRILKQQGAQRVDVWCCARATTHIQGLAKSCNSIENAHR